MAYKVWCKIALFIFPLPDFIAHDTIVGMGVNIDKSRHQDLTFNVDGLLGRDFSFKISDGHDLVSSYGHICVKPGIACPVQHLSIDKEDIAV